MLKMLTGGEEEDLFSIWKFTQGLPVYANPHDIPFAVSTYNWGFYFLYGVVAKFILTWLHLDDVWLPTICRLFTLGLSAVCGGLFLLILRGRENAWRFWPPVLLVIVSFSPLFGPLAGNWPMTTRPDMGAVMFEVAGLTLFIHFLGSRRLLLVFFAALSFYAAWSFKQANLSALAGTCAACLVLREWRALFLLVGLWLFLAVGTLWVGGPVYRDNVITNQLHFPFSFTQETKYFFWAMGRNPFMVMSLLAMVFLASSKPFTLMGQPVELTLLITSVVAFLLTVASLGKVGSDTNYFIPFATWSLLWFLLLADRMDARFLSASLIFFSWVLIFKLGFIFSTGIAVPDSVREPYQTLSWKLENLPVPIFVSDRIGNLPWIQRKPPYFVVNSGYGFEVNAGVSEAHGGWEGLMRDGYFGTVVTSADCPIPPELLARYTLLSSDGTFQYYQRKL